MTNFLDNFGKNAKNDFVVYNLMGGTSLNIKGTNLDETAAVFSLMAFDTDKECDHEVPADFKEGEGYVLTGTDQQSGKFAIHLIMTKKKSKENLPISDILKTFKKF